MQGVSASKIAVVSLSKSFDSISAVDNIDRLQRSSRDVTTLPTVMSRWLSTVLPDDANPEVTVEHPHDQPDLVRVHVAPGPRVRIEDVRIEVRGPIVERLALGDPQAQAAQREMRLNWALPTGAPFRNADWVSAKNGALARLRAQGYLGATWASTSFKLARSAPCSPAQRADSTPGMPLSASTHRPESSATAGRPV